MMNDSIKEKTLFKDEKDTISTAHYEIEVTGDMNDADYVYSDFRLDNIFNLDELLLLILCYFSTDYEGSWFSSMSYSDICGRNFEDDDLFPWLSSYLYTASELYNLNLVPYDAHSIESLDIIFIDKDGTRKIVFLPEMYELFEDKDTMVNYINNLFDNFKKEHLERLQAYGYEED